ncbi:MAG: hypothetical protein II986_08130 [Alistipes sp.]|nr:hypothetical protein [Alistipes sp.]
MRRFFYTLLPLLSLTLVGCDNGDSWTPRHQISRINALIADYPATTDDFLQFISDIENGVWDIDNWVTYRNGDIWNTSYSGFVNTAFGRGSQFLDLVFYADGTCRQCYLYAPAPYNNIPYPFLYTTLLWSFDLDSLTLTLTNSDYQALGSPYYQTSLRLKYYRFGEFIMDGLQPSPEALNGYTIRYIGDTGNAAERAEYQERYKDERIYSTLNGSNFR